MLPSMNDQLTDLLALCITANTRLQIAQGDMSLPLDIRIAALNAHCDMLGLEVKVRTLLLEEMTKP